MTASNSCVRVACYGVVAAALTFTVGTAFGQGAVKVPPAITDAGEFGENIYDAVKGGDWTAAAEKLASLKKAAAQFTTEIPKMTADQKKSEAQLAQDIAAIEKAVAAKDKQAALEKSNDTTLVALELSIPFNPQIPASITRLDYLGRELQVWAGPNDVKKLQQVAAEIQTTWSKVQPSIQAKGAAEVAKRFTNLVGLVSAAKTAKEYEAAAAPLLDEVDNLEKVFD
jgi:hypothetical protein